MLKKVLLAIALLVCYFSIGQVPNGLPQRFSGKWYQFQYYASVDSGFLTPLRDTNYRPSRIGAVTTRPSDSLMYRWTGSKWDLIGRGGSFGVYTAGNGLSLSGNTFSADTSSVGLATRNRVKKVADSLGALISGTVPTTTSVSTSFGLEGGGTLATSLSLEADTLQLSTRAWRQKGVDSVRNLLNNYVLLTRNVTTGYGLSGGGNLTTDRVILADTLALSSRAWRQKLADSLGGVISSITPDTLTLSTRAWRQKAVDSLNGLISTRLTIADSATFSTKAYRQKAVDSLLSVFNTGVSGTANTIAMFTGSNSVGNSALSQTSTTMTLASRKLNITLPTDTSIVGTLVGTGINVGSQWVFKNDYNTTGGFVGIAAGETSGDMVLAVGANKKLVFGLGTVGNSRGAEFSENAFKIFQAAGNTSNWVTLGSLTGTQTWLFGGVTSTTGLTLRTTEYVNVTINGTAYKFALAN